MKHISLACGAAFAALLLVGGCRAGVTQDKAAAAPPRNGPELASADVARPPAAPDDANAAEAEPLDDAGEIAAEIASNTMVERVPVDGGLAWVQDGEVLRTASSDGRRISYFHPGESEPFLVQEGQSAYAYDRGRPRLAYDGDGRAASVPDAARAKAQRLADESRREADAAERARSAGSNS
jgi:hypothetical protein